MSHNQVQYQARSYLEELRRHRFTPLTITTEHALAVETLPPHHADPFDRMLAPQAQVEKLTLVTRAARLLAYAMPILRTSDALSRD